MQQLETYTDTGTGEYMLCMMFEKYMRWRRRNIPNYTKAILDLERMSDVEPVFDKRTADTLVWNAITFAHGGYHGA